MEPSSEHAPNHLMADMRHFIIDQGEGRTAETRERYAQVADDLMAFIAAVDVEPWIGPELARFLAAERVAIGNHALLTSLGLVSFIRVVPAFVVEPWLPEPGAQRRTHRAAMRYLMTFLRARAQAEGHLIKDDFTRIGRALGSSYASDHRMPASGRDGTIACTVTIDLVEHLLDQLLESVTQGRYETLDDAVAARLNPILVSMWRDPEPDGWGRVGHEC